MTTITTFTPPATLPEPPAGFTHAGFRYHFAGQIEAGGSTVEAATAALARKLPDYLDLYARCRQYDAATGEEVLLEARWMGEAWSGWAA